MIFSSQSNFDNKLIDIWGPYNISYDQQIKEDIVDCLSNIFSIQNYLHVDHGWGYSSRDDNKLKTDIPELFKTTKYPIVIVAVSKNQYFLMAYSPSFQVQLSIKGSSIEKINVDSYSKAELNVSNFLHTPYTQYGDNYLLTTSKYITHLGPLLLNKTFFSIKKNEIAMRPNQAIVWVGKDVYKSNLKVFSFLLSLEEYAKEYSFLNNNPLLPKSLPFWKGDIKDVIL